MWTNSEFIGLLTFFKLTHPGTKSKRRNKTLPTFQKLPSGPTPVGILVFCSNHFPGIMLCLNIISSGLLHHMSFYVREQSYDFDIKIIPIIADSFLFSFSFLYPLYKYYTLCLLIIFLWKIKFSNWGHFKECS